MTDKNPIPNPTDWISVNFSLNMSTPIKTVAIRDTIDQITPVIESWFFSKIAGIQAEALIISTKRNIRNNAHPGLIANFLDRNSPEAKKIAEMIIHIHAGISVNIATETFYHEKKFVKIMRRVWRYPSSSG